ncbi:acyltransferase [bacterium]|nr:acyltransferase [bacterium]
MRVGYLQFEPVFGDPHTNREKIKMMIRGIKADILVLPELCTTGYTFIDKEELLSLSDEIPNGEDAQFFLDLSSQTGCAFVAGLAEKEGDKSFNSSVFTTPDGFISKYRKLHLFNVEKNYFEPGNEGFKVFDFNDVKIGIAICFDWYFPEAMRILALKGADIITHPSNLVLPFCQDAMITRSIENRVFTITANRIGRETRGSNDFKFTGKSQITSPSGELLKRAESSNEEIGIVDINPTLARDKSMTPNNSLFSDRRKNFYGDLVIR